MARVKRAVNAQKKRRTILKASKGYRGQRSRLYRKAKEQQLHSLTYAYRDRRARKGEFRKLWIARINAAARANDITYNRFIQGLKIAGVEVDRKNLAELAVSDAAAFTALVEVAKAALPEDVNAPAGGSRLSDSLLTERSQTVIDAVKLHRPAARRRAGLFLAEGPNLVEAALRSGAAEQIYATESAAARFADLLTGAPVRLVTDRAAKALSDTVTPVGLVAVCRSVAVPSSLVLDRSPRFVVVAVDISEPGNAGTLIRVADAMGADAVILAGNSVDPFNGKTLRASAGSIFNVPVVSDAPAEAVLHELSGQGVAILATTLDGDLSLDDADSVLSGPCAWVFGNEAHGLDEAMARLATHRVVIPMRGGAESLNLASAASICLYATARAHRRLTPE